MNIESNRLSTFTNWPSSAPVDPIRIAKAGFFYTGEGTEVQCFSCGGKISEWNYGDQVMCRHRTMEPNCAFVANPEGSENVPLVLGPEHPEPDSSANAQNPEAEVLNPEESQAFSTNPEDEMYRSDVLRLLTFINFDDTSVSPRDLANVGFYRTSEGRLRCAWCGGELSRIENFGLLGHPLEIHRTYFPHCSFAAGLEVAREATAVSRSASPFSYTPPLVEPVNNQPQSSGAIHNAGVLAAGGTWRTLNVVGGSARHPAQASVAARLSTFNNWPSDRTQTPESLAEAGFFYGGADDQVRCFYCDGGLGRWEPGDTPWVEHARWFPHCGFVVLVKGPQFINECKAAAASRCLAENGQPPRRRTTGSIYPLSEAAVTECMESDVSLQALSAGLDAARVRRAIVRRLRATGTPFTRSDALIDAVLDEQLNEEAWSVAPHSQRLARDILAETLRDYVPGQGLFQPQPNGDSSATPPQSDSTDEATEVPRSEGSTSTSVADKDPSKGDRIRSKTPEVKKKLTLEEENRQLREARLCKVCMDSEVSVVFLPCGHLVSCGGCGAALSACPLCRCAVRALVRAYLA